MPVPGPRGQRAPLPGYTNPDGEHPDRFQRWKRPGPVSDPGRSPGTMFLSVRGNILAAGTIRIMWRQTVDFIAAQNPVSWTAGLPVKSRPRALDITRSLRYMARSLYVAGGTDNSRYSNLHTQIKPRVNHKPVTIGGGQVRNRPTVRNRLTSFGSRVPTLNDKVRAAE